MNLARVFTFYSSIPRIVRYPRFVRETLVGSRKVKMARRMICIMRFSARRDSMARGQTLESLPNSQASGNSDLLIFNQLIPPRNDKLMTGLNFVLTP